MKRNQYDETFKSEAVKLALSGELSYAEIARDLGVNYGTLTNWIYATMVIPPKRAASKSRINTSPAFSAGRVSLLKPSYAFALE